MKSVRRGINLRNVIKLFDVSLLVTACLLTMLLLDKLTTELENAQRNNKDSVTEEQEEDFGVSPELLERVDMEYYNRVKFLPEDVPLWQLPEPNPSFTSWNRKLCTPSEIRK